MPTPTIGRTTSATRRSTFGLIVGLAAMALVATTSPAAYAGPPTCLGVVATMSGTPGDDIILGSPTTPSKAVMGTICSRAEAMTTCSSAETTPMTSSAVKVSTGSGEGTATTACSGPRPRHHPGPRRARRPLGQRRGRWPVRWSRNGRLERRSGIRQVRRGSWVVRFRRLVRAETPHPLTDHGSSGMPHLRRAEGRSSLVQVRGRTEGRPFG